MCASLCGAHRLNTYHLPLPDFEVVHVAEHDMIVAYEVDVKSSNSIRDAVVGAQHKLLHEISKQRYNALVQEGYVPTRCSAGGARG
jgi:hypothetical protein